MFVTLSKLRTFALVIVGTILTSTSVLRYLAYQVATTIYDVWFGPLSKFPGPKLWAASNLPLVCMLWRGQDTQAKHRLHTQYGPVVRVSPTEISYIDADTYANGLSGKNAWKEIYGHRLSGKRSFAKDRRLYAIPVNGTTSILSSDDASHSRQRRVLSHAFSDKALKEEEPLFKRWASLLVDKLEALSFTDAPIDLVAYYNFTTFDIMGELTFAESLHMLEGSEYSPWVATIFASIKSMTRLRAVRLIPGMTTLLNIFLTNAIRKKQVSHFKYSADRVDRRLETTPSKPDLWSFVLKKAGQEGGMSLSEMHSNSAMFMIAGTETTATLLSGLTYHLLQNPATTERLTRELRSAFMTDKDITIEALQQLPYLSACIEEGMRLYPPVPTGLPRQTPKGGARICGEYIPEDITVSVSQWATYHSEANFYDAGSFIPERWLEQDSRFENDNHAAFQPFSTGPRNCIGRNLAYHECRLLLTEVFWNFDLELMPESSKWTNQKVFSFWDKSPLWVKLRRVVR
ncbi:cytochrome P450 [Aureobasidium pullulans]|uniref:Cytochrome P450 n=1 Tax=Aureobasidium pullulans TaxID=5580 RepID=A0A4S9EFA7_AURPU|nr:cytochrome P450 [Aureobasidium pullulans]THX32852.1 cytochrome P450 [Aureobasidium pullulans]THX63316.1 cytochrome P450 [Aureobasidium pullulans]